MQSNGADIAVEVQYNINFYNITGIISNIIILVRAGTFYAETHRHPC